MDHSNADDETNMTRGLSPFLHLGSETKVNSLAIIHLSRDRLEPLYLEQIDGEHDGYAEGAVLNTRFGSFPHTTLIGVPWGSQIRASAVDTGSRGRKPQKKRKRPVEDVGSRDETPTGGNNTETTTDQGVAGANDAQKSGAKKAVAASSGFVHILAPTPELWTMSLPHRTQVVYTPDYSYILQRIRARPGTKLIEAGAGSGSFTHASARAVYNGMPSRGELAAHLGKVFSFEFDEPRYKKMCEEIATHKLAGLVQITHRDVYKNGFLVDEKSPGAEAVFLDLPAPWEALPHLARRRNKMPQEDGGDSDVDPAQNQVSDEKFVSPLNPKKSVYLCSFSPCIEQVTRTVSVMRRLGWMDIETVEIANKRIHVLREKIGLTVATDRGLAQQPADVMEAVTRLKKIEERAQEHQRALHDPDIDDVEEYLRVNVDEPAMEEQMLAAGAEGKLPHWMQGRVVTRPETEMRTHTSYLTFAILPREWTAEDEAAAFARWPCGQENKVVIGSLDKEARKQQKREMLQPKRKRKGGAEAKGGDGSSPQQQQQQQSGEQEEGGAATSEGPIAETLQSKRPREEAQGGNEEDECTKPKRRKVDIDTQDA